MTEPQDWDSTTLPSVDRWLRPAVSHSRSTSTQDKTQSAIEKMCSAIEKMCRILISKRHQDSVLRYFRSYPCSQSVPWTDGFRCIGKEKGLFRALLRSPSKHTHLLPLSESKFATPWWHATIAVTIIFDRSGHKQVWTENTRHV